jgi:beta-lactamase regulating signal transducer with metallopeptidase domain
METLLEFFNAYWLRIFGSTLLHSLWQGLLITGVITLILQLIPGKQSNVRYGVALVGLLLIVVSSIITFTYLYAPPGESASSDVNQIQLIINQVQPKITLATYLAQSAAYIQSVVPFFIIGWIAGVIFFLARMVTGLVYINKLKAHSVPLVDKWSDYIHELTLKLKINRTIRLAESALIHAPVVFGFLKPIILIPVGMCTALSTHQLETILLHEMMHIRRRDYVANLIQTCIEAIYFFNPFVWMLSSFIKQEREHCCDDAVVRLHGSASEYVHALSALEEIRLTKVGVSLSFAESKNQLLTRIKRIMEKSAKSYSGRERIVPALLLVIGLVCTSWMTTRTYVNEESGSIQSVINDTTKKVKKNKKPDTAASSKKDNQNKKREATGKKSDQESNKESLNEAEKSENDDSFGFNGSTFPNPSAELDIPLPPLPSGVIVPPLSLDSDFHGLGLQGDVAADVEKFAQEFEKSFKGTFADFYKEHGEEMQQMMTELQQKFEGDFGDEWKVNIENFAAKQEEWATEHAKDWEQHAKSMSVLEEGSMKELEKNHAELEKEMNALREKSHRFEEALKNELIKDGYLRGDDKLETIHWRNGKIEFNGKPIKPSDEKKYNELHEKYFSGHEETSDEQ